MVRDLDVERILESINYYWYHMTNYYVINIPKTYRRIYIYIIESVTQGQKNHYSIVDCVPGFKEERKYLDIDQLTNILMDTLNIDNIQTTLF